VIDGANRRIRPELALPGWCTSLVTDERPPLPGRDRRRSGLRHALREAVADERDGPLPAMLLALTALAGLVDAASILALNHVFVAAMTGNLVFVGLGLAGASFFSATHAGIALAGFVVGALLGAHTCRHSSGHRGLAVRNIAITKAALAVPVTVIAVASGGDLDAWARTVVTVLLAVSMGGQLALIRYLKVPDLVTAVLTLTLTGAVTERSGVRDPAVLRRGLALLAFALGVVAGGLLTRLVAVGAALALGLAIIVVVGVAAHLASRTPRTWSPAR
jgi:uncharacterized membrane protein YoaK (UPF0700 family)